MQVLLVDLPDLLMPAVVRQQGHVPRSNGAHLHGAGRPLHRVEVVHSLMQDKRRSLAVQRAVGGISQPPSLRHGIPRDEHVPQLLLGERLVGKHLPDIGLAGGGPFITLRDVNGIQGAQAVDGAALGVRCEDVGHGELRGWLGAPEVGHVQPAVDQRGDGLVVPAWEMRRDWRGEAREDDVGLPLVERRRYDHDVVQGVRWAEVPDVIHLIETGHGA